jgi:hypothetical protein
MNRRDFNKTVGLVATAAVVEPKILAEQFNPHKMTRLYLDSNGKWQSEPVLDYKPVDLDDDWDKSTPEQRAAIRRMHDNMPSHDIFKKVASETSQLVPLFTKRDGTVKTSFQHGNSLMLGSIDGLPSYHYENGYTYDKEGNRKEIIDPDLSNICYFGIYRQGVRNKYTNEAALFVATIPLEFAQEVNPGQTISFEKRIPIGTPDAEIERMARESFLKLQELVVEYHNREM